MTERGGSTGTGERWLLTGGSGALGTMIAGQLLERGVTVRILDMVPPADPELAAKCEVVVGNLADEELVRSALTGVDVVIHSAAVVWTPERTTQEYIDVNVYGTRKLLAMARQASVRGFVFTSSVSVVFDGKSPQYDADETTPYPADPTCMDDYARSKRLAEGDVLASSDNVMATCCLRLGGLFGPGDKYQLPVYIDAVRKGLFFRMGDGKAKFDNLYFGNAAWAHVLAGSSLRPGSPSAGQVYFIGDDSTGNHFDFTGQFVEGLGMKAPSVKVPYKLMHAVAKVATTVYPKSPLTPFSVNLMCVNHSFSHAKATRDFGYTPRYSAQESYENTLKWLKAQGV